MPQISDFHVPQAAWLTMVGGTNSGPLELNNNRRSLNRVYAYFMVYGAEAMLPTDLDYDALRVKQYATKK
jgi:hypothetical protein